MVPVAVGHRLPSAKTPKWSCRLSPIRLFASIIVTTSLRPINTVMLAAPQADRPKASAALTRHTFSTVRLGVNKAVAGAASTPKVESPMEILSPAVALLLMRPMARLAPVAASVPPFSVATALLDVLVAISPLGPVAAEAAIATLPRPSDIRQTNTASTPALPATRLLPPSPLAPMEVVP